GNFAAQAEENLVGVHAAALGDGHEEVAQARLAAGQLGVLGDREIEDPCPLASEPTLRRHPLRQRFLKCHMSGLPRPGGSCSMMWIIIWLPSWPPPREPRRAAS